MKQIFIISVFLFAVNSLFAQFSVHLNYSGATKTGMGIGYDFNKKFWSDLTFARAFADAYSITDICADLSVNYNVVATKRYDTYLGAGMFLDLEDIFFRVPVGLRIRPFEKWNNIAFQIEMQTAVNFSSIYRNMVYFGNLGIRYHF